MLAALLALLASILRAPVAHFIEHDPCPRGCIVGDSGWGYQVTRGDLVWLKDVIDDLSKTFGAMRSALNRADLPADAQNEIRNALKDCTYLD